MYSLKGKQAAPPDFLKTSALLDIKIIFNDKKFCIMYLQGKPLRNKIEAWMNDNIWYNVLFQAPVENGLIKSIVMVGNRLDSIQFIYLKMWRKQKNLH